MANRSAVIVEIELPAVLAAVRDAHDWAAARGVAPHVTLLFPFLPVDRLTTHVREELANLASGTRPFTVRFDEVVPGEGLVWLLPVDQRPFLELTASITARWPDYPPYEGIHDELIAHLTLVASDDFAALDQARVVATAQGPIEFPVDGLTVITEDDEGRWATRWRLPLAHSR